MFQSPLRSLFLICYLTSLFCGPARAQHVQSHDEYMERLFESFDYLDVADSLPFVITPEIQMVASAGREDLIAGFFDRLVRDDCVGNTIFDASEAAKLVAGQRIVIINEAHMMPLHRHYIAELLDGMVSNREVVYAAETFSRTVNDQSTIDVTSGHYTSDPIYARLIYDLVERDVPVISYEADTEGASGDRLAAREAGQANNLKDTINKLDNTTAILIHVGWDHVFEKPDNYGNHWMAMRLAELLGTDPLTISQTFCRSDSGSPIIAEARRGSRGAEQANKFDIAIGTPRLEFQRNRPNWRREIGDIEVEIPEDHQSNTEAVIVEVYPIEIYRVNLPVERVYVRPGENIPLLIPPGTYTIKSFVRGGAYGTASRFVVAANTERN